MHKPSSIPRKQIITTLGEILAEQTVLTTQMQLLRELFGPEATVLVEKLETPFGTYCTKIDPVHTITFRGVYGGKVVKRYISDQGQSMDSLCQSARRMRSGVEAEHPGVEFYVSRIEHSCNGDVSTWPNPETLAN